MLLPVQVLHLLGDEGPNTPEPAKYIRYIYNRIILENATVRASAVSALAKFGARCPALRRRIVVLLRRCLHDNDDEARYKPSQSRRSKPSQTLTSCCKQSHVAAPAAPWKCLLWSLPAQCPRRLDAAAQVRDRAVFALSVLGSEEDAAAPPSAALSAGLLVSGAGLKARLRRCAASLRAMLAPAVSLGLEQHVGYPRTWLRLALGLSRATLTPCHRRAAACVLACAGACSDACADGPCAAACAAAACADACAPPFQVSLPALESALKAYLCAESDAPFDMSPVPNEDVDAVVTHGPAAAKAAATAAAAAARTPAPAERSQRATEDAELLNGIAAFAELGKLFKSSEPVQLTEDETEYKARRLVRLRLPGV